MELNVGSSVHKKTLMLYKLFSRNKMQFLLLLLGQLSDVEYNPTNDFELLMFYLWLAINNETDFIKYDNLSSRKHNI